MAKQSKYQARHPDADGQIAYRTDEHRRWARLMARQQHPLSQYAAPQYLRALEALDLPADQIPQCREVSQKLRATTGWSVEPVPALIDFTTFFTMLSERRFPAASFIRSWKEMDYLEEPDIFHEILGHTPLLADADYAAFVHNYGKTGCRATREERVWLARLFWFTVEFGLLHTRSGLKAFGAGIVSSFSELSYAIESPAVNRRPFDPIEILRTPYRIDRLQTDYFVLDSLEQLYALADEDLLALVHQAMRAGLRPSTVKYQPVSPEARQTVSHAS
ncbi:MAG: phenylalanine 4-monooxygenase [Gammaproteobacteria bacterium]|nr:phenylalanine 4-monooxygenase [Gammaproteobacteria bacterium]